MDIIEIAKECGAEIYHEGEPGHDKNYPWVQFMTNELQQFAQRIEAPHLQRIAELEKDCEILQTNLDDALRYKRADEKLVDIINGIGQQQQKPKHGRQA